MNAIILAAGRGSRLYQLTNDIPKPLTKIYGVPIVEQQISYLQEIGINDIFIVVGYKSECFGYLAEKYGVRLIYNPHYHKYNNIYSLFLCREVLEDSYIIEGDSFPTTNFLLKSPSQSTYFTGLKNCLASEWILRFNSSNILYDIVIHNESNSPIHTPSFIMSGFSFWSKKDSDTIQALLQNIISPEGIFIKPDYQNQYWDYLIYENLEKYSVQIQIVSSTDWYEVDTLLDLHKLSDYIRTTI